jgi:hypothetical protein
MKENDASMGRSPGNIKFRQIDGDIKSSLAELLVDLSKYNNPLSCDSAACSAAILRSRCHHRRGQLRLQAVRALSWPNAPIYRMAALRQQQSFDHRMLWNIAPTDIACSKRYQFAD